MALELLLTFTQMGIWGRISTFDISFWKTSSCLLTFPIHPV